MRKGTAGLVLAAGAVVVISAQPTLASGQTTSRVHRVSLVTVATAIPGSGDYRSAVAVSPDGCAPTGSVNFARSATEALSTMQAEFYCNAWQGPPPWVHIEAHLVDQTRAQNVGPGNDYVDTHPFDGPSIDATTVADPFAYATFPTGMLETIRVVADTADGSVWILDRPGGGNPYGTCTYGSYFSAPNSPPRLDELVCNIEQSVTATPSSTWGTYPVPA
jgi:hypothetical protein